MLLNSPCCCCCEGEAKNELCAAAAGFALAAAAPPNVNPAFDGGGGGADVDPNPEFDADPKPVFDADPNPPAVGAGVDPNVNPPDAAWEGGAPNRPIGLASLVFVVSWALDCCPKTGFGSSVFCSMFSSRATILSRTAVSVLSIGLF